MLRSCAHEPARVPAKGMVDDGGTGILLTVFAQDEVGERKLQPLLPLLEKLEYGRSAHAERLRYLAWPKLVADVHGSHERSWPELKVLNMSFHSAVKVVHPKSWLMDDGNVEHICAMFPFARLNCRCFYAHRWFAYTGM